ncbi:GNAT family N-acetyltransferase [Zhihengliuella halotolerans]|uniref:GNAT family N-acetyltransferase n=1 Tax=Zhihengliuella halotolerans TaxID=370736 RepID=UPI0021554505|nr:GNAT family N-acetyltransferase [Zhihengliuella halotolerans]
MANRLGKFVIRRARTEDLDALHAMQDAAGHPRWGGDALQSSGHRVVQVALLGGALVGAGKTHLHREPDGPAPAGHYLGGVVVHPRFRRQCVGAGLTLARLDWIWERAESAYYFTNERNTASLRMHSQLGFAEIARRPSFHGVPADDPLSQLVLFRAAR